jgi:phage repressor protein C with HTH and peptisase S24 domain
MSPRFEPGQRVAVSPREPVSIGDDVIVQLRGAEGDDERVKMVLVKRLVRRTPSFIELRQFNPDTTFRVEAKRVAALHKVKGALF